MSRGSSQAVVAMVGSMLENMDSFETDYDSPGCTLDEHDDDDDDDDDLSSTDDSATADYDSSTDLSNYSLNHNLQKDGKIEEVRVTEEDKKSGLFLSLEMVQMLRLSTSEGNLLPPEIVDKMTPPGANDTAGDSSPKQAVARRHSGGELPRSGGNRMVFALQTKSAMESHAHHANAESNIPKPVETLTKLLEARGLTFTTRKSIDNKHLFTEGCVSSHTLELMNAVRHNDMAVIRQLWERGHNFQSSNRFGESVVHSAARRGSLQVLVFFKEMANVSLRCACHQGRTPLHDACWTGQPEFGVIRYLLRDFPESLYLTDTRGFTPLDFIPREAHEEWNEFLEENIDLCLPGGFDGDG